MNLPIPLAVVYAGLGGTLLALIVATATNGWQLRVFFLLALRLAIGWHFLFEGLHKIHSHYLGATENSRTFTSEPYFTVAEGPLGPLMRKQFLVDTDAVIAARVAPQADKLAGFGNLNVDEQVALCPKVVADAFEKASEEGFPAATDDLQKAKEAFTKADKDAAALANGDAKKLEDAKKKVTEAKGKVDAAEAKLAAMQNEGKSLKLTYVRWMYGADRRDAKVKYVSTDVPQTVTERLAHISLLQKQLDNLNTRESPGLGNGYGYDLKKVAGARTDLATAKSDLVSDANIFVEELVKYVGGKPPIAPVKEIVQMDKLTMWVITIVGACLMFGLFTPLACLVAAGFLTLTYLTHPPFPWLPLPPGTEGNPLFINKNVIEMLALLAIAVHPTGRWLGLDALWTWLLFDCRKPKNGIADH